MVTFEETSTPGRILVKRIVERELGKPLPVTVGLIAKDPDGRFSYFEPETNEQDAKITDDTLESLKKQVRALYQVA